MGQIFLGAIALGLLWAVMTLGVYISYRVLEIADLTVEGSITLGGAVCAVQIRNGVDPLLATGIALFSGLLAGLASGLLHTKLKIPALLSGILTMIALWSVNLRVMGSANVSILRMGTVFSSVQALGLSKYWTWIAVGTGLALAIIAALYWFFGTELGSAIRATGNNQNMVRRVFIQI
jgi:putative ABC transport system permease protein